MHVRLMSHQPVLIRDLLLSLLTVLVIVAGGFSLALPVAAQADPTPDPEAGLTVQDVEIVTRPDIFGGEGEMLFADGLLVNTATATAYTSITLFAEILDADGEPVGEGIGYPVNECGTGLLDFSLQPGAEQRFSIALELYEADVAYDRVEIFPEVTETEPAPVEAANPFLTGRGLTTVHRGEVVAVEWLEGGGVRYGVGCDADAFTAYTWYEYDPAAAASTPVTHPGVELITPAMLRQTGLDEGDLFNRSYFSFHPDDRRVVYQTDLNSVITAERDGSFKRIIYDDLSRISLHGINWLPEGRFLAYYYGAYGDPVRYFTASTAGQRISDDVYSVVPSQTIPGANPDGTRVVIGTTINEKTGYFLTSSLSGEAQFILESPLPGNNYPAPIYVSKAGGTACVYLVRELDGQARLEMLDLDTGELSTPLLLPLALTTDDRAWTWLSPDQTTLALAANGQAGGLWLIDLTRLAICGAS